LCYSPQLQIVSIPAFAVALETGYASNVVGWFNYIISSKRNAFKQNLNMAQLTRRKVLGLAKNSYGIFETAST
jgi:electron transfer flavoprotein alpha subunit